MVRGAVGFARSGGDGRALTGVRDFIVVLDGSSRHLRDGTAHQVASARVHVPRPAAAAFLRGGPARVEGR